MSIFPKLTYRYNAIHLKNPSKVFDKHKRAFLTFIWKDPRIAQTILKNKVEGLPLPAIKSYYIRLLQKSYYKNQDYR